ncbi:hypothetical protein N825_23315 [Skermanella stibiiresistens SB22]|uniref:Uncharacterized protein n=1 Tax=Skermanella stibiiresistens SB22 TaxID=1385369 RepID=W9GSG3_9PROT|nr:hypothetical protein [Skermanella stibiiresistens]EWY36835.1 hypothetical protein N825_23315 [Skermanella stibiiresistens SB22]
MRARLAALLLLASLHPAFATDIEVLRNVRWGMAPPDIAKALGDDATRLPGRWDFGRYYADTTVEDVQVASIGFRAFLQIDRQTGGLGQILLERRGRQASPVVFDDIVKALTDRFGSPEKSDQQNTAAVPKSLRVVWRLPDFTINASFFDFRTTAIVSENPNVDRDPLTPFSERQRNNPRFLPRRALIRFNPP